VTPLQKLIQMLDDLVSKGKSEKQTEEVEFAKYQVWCTEVRDARTKSIEEGAAKIEQLTADIEKAEADAVSLAEEIEALEAQVAKDTEELESATKVRNKEVEDYDAMHKDISESVDACQRAIQALSARKEDVPQSLLQVQRLALVPTHAKEAIESFLQLRERSSTDSEAPEANAYEFQSGGVVSMVEKLEHKFKEELMALEKEEISRKSSYEQLKQQLEDDIEADTAHVKENRRRRAQRLENAADAKIELEDTKGTKADDEKVLGDTNAECLERSQEYEQNQVSRGGEITALGQALKILNSDKVKGSADEHLPAAALLQVRREAGRALVQLQDAARRRAVELLQARARATSSRYLAVAASVAAADPFAKVRKMVKDMIQKLTEEETAEAEQHAYCTSELDVNAKTRKTKTAEVEELTAQIEQLTSESERLTTEIRDLTADIAGISDEKAEASRVREEEKKTNNKVIADAKAAQVAVEKATKVLREYYDKAAAAASMLQSGEEGQEGEREFRQEMFSVVRAPYKGQQSASTGIFGMMDVVLSDFTRLETETQTAEATADSNYKKFMTDSEESVEIKQAEIENKEGRKQMADEKIRRNEKELKLTQEELDKAKEYHDKLKAECVDTGLSYEDKKAAREEEIQALQDALAVLDQKGS